MAFIPIGEVGTRRATRNTRLNEGGGYKKSYETMKVEVFIEKSV